MEDKLLMGKSMEQWINEYPLLQKVIEPKEVFWTNPRYKKFEEAMKKISISSKDVAEAEERLERFAPYIAKVFPETKAQDGIIESPLAKIPKMKDRIKQIFHQEIQGELLLKLDSHLPISGSIKARGGIYEVLKHAEDLALKHHMLKLEDDYSVIANEEFKKFFSNYSIAVGSTGNLGLSIGIMSAKLGFKVVVHMSADAKQWKKDLLRSKGVTVIEYDSDYSKAVEEGRKQAEQDKNMYFIDDENSKNLFLGYAVAASRMKKQLDEMNILVDQEHPMFVYLPCGVGGGPGGIAFGLKLVYKDHVHCFFAEPTHSPCMLIGLMTEQHDQLSVQDFGVDNKTAADGLAVGRASSFIGKTLEELLSGVYTVEDDTLFLLLSQLADAEDIFLEPSALAGMPGAIDLLKTEAGQQYIKQQDLEYKMKASTHVVWATGGSMVPKEEMTKYYERGLSMRRI